METLKSAGILIESKGKFLLGHATNLETGGIGFFDQRWTIPKGIIDDGETSIDAAIRETLEETGIDVVNLGFHPTFYKSISYTVKTETVHYKKELDIFYINDEVGSLQDKLFVCTSMITGTVVPEIDKFLWVNKEQCKLMVFKSLIQLFTN